MNIKELRLPTDGILKDVPQTITIREMNGGELSMLYSNFSDEAIDEVVKNIIMTEGIEVDNLAEQDKHIILHMTRVLTFGSTIQQTLRCPVCGHTHTYDIDYDKFKITYLDKDFNKNREFKVGDNIYTKRIPTVGDMKELKRFKEKFQITHKDDFILIHLVQIELVNNKKIGNFELLNLLKDLPGRELLEVTENLKTEFGLDTTFQVECDSCQNIIPGGLGITPNLFR